MIEDIPFFKHLSKDDIEKIKNISVVQKYKKDEILFIEGEEPKWLSILLKGRLKIYKTSPKGKEIFMHEIHPINFIAEVVNFKNLRYPASSVFIADGEVLKIDYPKFKEIFMDNPLLVFELLKSLSDKLKVINEVFIREVILDSDGKVAKFICEDFDIFTTLKHSQSAKILNITPETFSRSITKFKNLGLLECTNSQITGFKNELMEFYKV
ncbi:Crp/Fnr family transcriptional regulator [Campylobacter corcagiensis]|uniref:Crp/Fnr family transcriptional regulator n=1 Tax=Campylobacter corcagiensis TaxID=1448857 RepID=A0A7M1LEW4_9BACT|nr:Crp/Fnr family transcriptional regulator [Campylobacter corcagiensis]QKF64962.1 putative nitrosative stress-response regulator NssR, Crp/Fnr family [Campylobacter corcagiensis]QOQ86881.1 Crp/Fnr family transcriptional regulator [Campylobacter corcagiensis]